MVNPSSARVSAIHVDPVVPKRPCGAIIIALPHHQAARENTDGTFENTHIYVHFKAVYTLALKQRLGKGN